MLCVFALSKVVFWQADNVCEFLTERLLLAVSLSGLSGCDSAYLFACCTGEQHRRVFAWWEAVQTAGMLLAALVWPLLGGDYRYSALLTVASYTVAALLTLGLKEPVGQRAEEQRQEPVPKLGVLLRETRSLVPFLLAFCLFDQTGQMGTVFLSQLQYQRAGIPESAFGVLSALTTAAGLMGVFSHRFVQNGRTERVCTQLMAAGTGVCLLLWACPLPAAAVGGILTLRALRACMLPLALSVQNERIGVGGRAARLSCNAMVVDLGAVVIQPAFGILADCSVAWAFLLGGNLLRHRGGTALRSQKSCTGRN